MVLKPLFIRLGENLLLPLKWMATMPKVIRTDTHLKIISKLAFKMYASSGAHFDFKQ